eukprot:TRINITY_DN24374_c0_g1_i1.p1 TRINITY_DN24374_c0_g1~~TRINITY_DN24374_c0_g1_i1.p1  ORF type:complete len:318 (-),score=71.01 TRINITY_DN24374_c0_g1_i1:149-1039(-)
MTLRTVPSGVALADEALQEQPPLKWARQESNSSTAVPGTPSSHFGRGITPLDSDLESDSEARMQFQCAAAQLGSGFDFYDFYETRGGMASLCSEAERHCSKGLTTDFDDDFLELRGGLAAWAARKRRLDQLDAYEARGGMAMHCEFPEQLKPEVKTSTDDVDLLEARGGFASWAAKRHCPDFDPFEARGGMAEQFVVPEPLKPSAALDLIDDSDVDGFEARGGLAVWTARKRRFDEPGFDAYESRGGVALGYVFPEPPKPDELHSRDHSDIDVFEVRGGMAAWAMAKRCRLVAGLA